ncbi:hypothetical protein FGG78_32990 [Thioclava sp. BHET1]|nr:hypothetical protein FGG78_32990 [Thioclava sp. BHET1]
MTDKLDGRLPNFKSANMALVGGLVGCGGGALLGAPIGEASKAISEVASGKAENFSQTSIQSLEDLIGTSLSGDLGATLGSVVDVEISNLPSLKFSTPSASYDSSKLDGYSLGTAIGSAPSNTLPTSAIDASLFGNQDGYALSGPPEFLRQRRLCWKSNLK